MENLKAYLSTIEPVLLNQLSGKPKEFISLYRTHNFLTEKAFIKAFCGKKYDEPYYHDWKSKTINILQALAVVSNTRGGSTTKKKFDQCQKKFLLAQKFITQGERSEGIRLVKQAYQLATEYDFTHLA